MLGEKNALKTKINQEIYTISGTKFICTEKPANQKNNSKFAGEKKKKRKITKPDYNRTTNFPICIDSGMSIVSMAIFDGLKGNVTEYENFKSINNAVSIILRSFNFCCILRINDIGTRSSNSSTGV